MPMIRAVHDEDIEVYLNGVLAMKKGGFTASLDDYPNSAFAAATLKTGKNVIAVHIHQTEGGQGADVGLVESLEKWGAGRLKCFRGV